jgi:hypothetical protein
MLHAARYSNNTVPVFISISHSESEQSPVTDTIAQSLLRIYYPRFWARRILARRLYY